MGLAKALASKVRKTPPFSAAEVEVMNGPVWAALSSTARWVYIVIKSFYRGNRAAFKAPFSGLKNRSGIKHGKTIANAISELEEKKWITVVRYAKHGKRKGLRVRANEYELTFLNDKWRW